MQVSMQNLFARYVDNINGHFGLWFAAAAFPLMIATSAVVDFRKAEANRAGIKGALDTAVLAAVSNNQISNQAKSAFAKDIFRDNYTGNAVLDLDVEATDGRVEMNATGYVPTSIGKAVGFKSVDVSDRSVAVMNRQNTICVLALAEDGKARLSFNDDAQFYSPTCSVQSNSVDAKGVISRTSSTPVAKSFCSAGGAVGEFYPFMRGECQKVTDPYRERRAPASGVCIDPNLFEAAPVSTAGGQGKGGKPGLIGGLVNTLLPGLRLGWLKDPETIRRLASTYSKDLINVAESVNYTGSNKILLPGTYCGGLTVNGQNVTFMPGNYIILDGPLTFKNGARAKAENVSFVLRGEKAVVTVESGSEVYLKAPKVGDMAGLAIYQDQQILGQAGKHTYPNGLNVISSGGSLNVVGTMYFPTQGLEVVGESELGAESPATSFIAYQIGFSGDTKAEVKVDHVAGGIPPMLPRSDDGARLVE